MAEWRFFRGWTGAELRPRLDALPQLRRNFEAEEPAMTGEAGWHHYHSEAVIAREPWSEGTMDRARAAVAHYRFSEPGIVTAHFDPDAPLLGRRQLLEVRVLGLRYLCPTVVTHVRDDHGVYGFRYDTLEGHIERGIEWFLLTEEADGGIRFRIEARWQRGDLPNWWSRLGFMLLSGYYQRRWHRQAHHRLSLLAHYGSTTPPRPDASGLAHQGVDVTFTYHTRRKFRP